MCATSGEHVSGLSQLTAMQDFAAKIVCDWACGIYL
jgi:hypothetical protein